MFAAYNHKIACFYFFCYVFSSAIGKNEQFVKKDCMGSGKEFCLHWLKYSERYKGTGTKFTIYCHKSAPKSIFHAWRSIYLLFENVPQEYKLFGGENDTDVYNKYQSETIWYPTSWASWRDTCVDFPAFSQYCLGVDTAETYTVQLVVRTVNYWKVLQTVTGIILFICAPSLSRNVAFHYASGISLGVLASILVVLFVLTRFIPKKSASYAFIFLGSSVMVYLIQQFYYSLPDILANYKGILLAYICISAVISFVMCYRFGPVQNAKTLHLIQWFMQCMALLLIFFSTEYREVSTCLIILVLTYYFMPSRWTRRIKAIWFSYFPPKVKLLTETEYIEQGNKETKKALEELRNYCSSPECKTWSTVMKLKDPKRFASFIEGDSHLTDEEMLLYDSEVPRYEDDSFLTDDEDRSTEICNNVRSNNSSW